jgi:raffinose/stachyose/melibiose transport system substrate-binding protein
MNTQNGSHVTQPESTRPRGRARGKLGAVAGAVAAALLVAACGGTGAGSGSSGTAGQPYAGNITYWFWGESDIPGITHWMQGTAAAYQKLHPKVHISIVPQSSSTLIGGFRIAAQSHSGPDLDTQWATLPTLTPYWDNSATPISDYVPSSQTSQWINTNENTTGGKIVAMPIYLIGVPLVWNKQLFRQAGLNPNTPPTTWSELLADCAALKAHGITPIGMGNKDGYFGAWMFAIFAKQELNSLSQLKSAIGNTGQFTQSQLDTVLRNLYTALQELVQKGYVNSDVSSLDLTQGWQLFPQKRAAMSFTTDGNALSWAKTVGEANVGVAPPPIWGNGALAGTYDVTQSSDEFITSWSQNKAAAANFLAWLHQPANMASLYQETGAFPADKRFPVSSISDPLAKQLFGLDTSKTSIWLENYLPPEVDSNADIPAGQMILSGSGSVSQAVALWNRMLQEWRVQQPTEFQQYKKWAANGS